MKRLLLPIALGFVLTAPYALYSQVIDQDKFCFRTTTRHCAEIVEVADKLCEDHECIPRVILDPSWLGNNRPLRRVWVCTIERGLRSINDEVFVASRFQPEEGQFGLATSVDLEPKECLQTMLCYCMDDEPEQDVIRKCVSAAPSTAMPVPQSRAMGDRCPN